jgi:hypothetical protein
MAGEATRAMLTIEFHDGTTQKWRFELAPDAPYAVEALKDSLVHEFAGSDKDSRNFEIKASGTFAAPEFSLIENQEMFLNREKLPS